MGLDSVEILMKVEDTFDIKIPRGEAEQIVTVGDFHNAVWRLFDGKHTDKCKSQNLFYKLRKAFAEKFDFSPQELGLDTSPEKIFPTINRRQAYSAFADSTNLKLPDLVLTRPWRILLTSVGLVTIVGGLLISLALINFLGFTKWILLLPVAGIILTYLLSYLLTPRRTAIKAITMREFVQHTLVLNYSALLVNEATNRKEMETVINFIIAEAVGLDVRKVTPEKKIADDLGID